MHPLLAISNFVPLTASKQCAGCHYRANTSTTSRSGGDEEKLQMQVRQAQQMAAAVARKKADALAKLKRLTDKQVFSLLASALAKDLLTSYFTSIMAYAWSSIKTCPRRQFRQPTSLNLLLHLQ